MLELDGSHGEGGGQMLRTALFLSCVTGQPFRMERIRKGRPKPGLKRQHAAILRLLADMTGSTADGAKAGAQEITFRPGSHKAGSYAADIGTAGCIPLLLQAVLPVAIATPGTTRLDLRGGTHVPFGPTMDWLEVAYLPWLRKLAGVDVHTKQVGFAPEGGGHVLVEVRQERAEAGDLGGLRGLVAEKAGARRHLQGTLGSVAVHSIAANVPRDVARRQALAAYAVVSALGRPAMAIADVAAAGAGSAVLCALEDSNGNVLAADRLGARGVPAENVGRMAAANVAEDWATGATVDRHMADHMAPWVALGAGAVRVPHVTPHLATNAWVCERFLGTNCVRTDRNLLR